MEIPFSQACENNKASILSVLKKYFFDVDSVLEVGSGTGQHAVYFAEQLPHLLWQPSDQLEYLDGISARLECSALSNLSSPILLNVNQPWPVARVHAIFTANTLHIMSWHEVQTLFLSIADVLGDGGLFCVYGPFNVKGEYSSDSNRRFDQWLKSRDLLSGIREINEVYKLANKAHLHLLENCEMPANNRCLVFKKSNK